MRAEARLRPGENSEGAAVHTRYAQTIFDREEAQAGLFAGLGEATGGRAFDPPELNASPAREIVGFLAGEVQTAYMIGFSPEPGATPSAYKVEIRLVGGTRGAKILGGFRMAVY
jgi:hypothetical protein